MKRGRLSGIANDPVSFDAGRLRRAITSAGLSQAQLSRDLGWNAGTVAAYLHRARCNYFALDAMCTRLSLVTDEVAS